jgi:hypothetical protein
MKQYLSPIEPPKDPALHDVWRLVELGRILNLKRRLGLQITIPKEALK